jgi:hypothetical protein
MFLNETNDDDQTYQRRLFWPEESCSILRIQRLQL